MRLGPPVRIFLVLLAAGLTAALALAAPGVIGGDAPALAVPWVPAAGLEFALRLDGLSLLFALIVCGVGTLVAIYAASYLEEGASGVRRFYAFLAVFLLSMLGVVVADDLLLLYVCWELTTLSSFFLIGFDSERPEARDAARHALLVTVAGGLALLAGVILLSIAGGTSRISELATRGDAIRAHPLYLPALATMALAAITKSAQVPFHSWLPRAMEAPTPASAYLHAATMVKAGIYLLARFSPMLAGTAEWSLVFGLVGALTMLVGAVRALGETHLKPMLAYSTIAALGLVVMLLGIGTPYAIAAAMIYVLAHALYKGALFLFAGALLHGAGAKDAEATRGIARVMPRTSIAALLAAASMAGVPATLGFLGKDLTYAATWPARSDDALGWAVLCASFVASALFVAVALVAGVRPLFARAKSAPGEARSGAHDPSLALWAPPLALAALGIAAGLFPALVTPLCRAAAQTIARTDVPASALSTHGFGREVVLSLVTLAAGAALFAGRAPLRRIGARVAGALRLRPTAGYELAMRALASAATRQTRVLQSGVLRTYLLVTVCAVVIAVTLTLTSGPGPRLEGTLEDLTVRDAALGVLVIAAAIVAASARSRFEAIAATGIVGFGVALLFLDLGAPDLAMTQFVVEALSVVVFVLAFYHLPHFAKMSPTRTRVRDATVATVLGTLVSVLVLAAASIVPEHPVSDWFLAQSVPAGHGRNVVNVILTDFRSLDTLGEIVVLGTAAFGVLALLRLRLGRADARSGAPP